MLGGLDAGKVVFRQQRWIDHPADYLMVDLAVTSPLEGQVTRLYGNVLGPSCTGFSVRRR